MSSSSITGTNLKIQSVTCHMGSHSVTWHGWTCLNLTPAK